MVLNKKLAAVLIGISLSGGYNMPVAQAGVTVPGDVRALADSLKTDANDMLVKEAAAKAAKANIAKMEDDLRKLQDEKAIEADEEIIRQLAKAKTDLAAAVVRQSQMETDRAKLEKQLRDIDQTLTEQKARFNQLDAEVQAADGSDQAADAYAGELRLDDIIGNLNEQDEQVYAQIQAMDAGFVKIQQEIKQLEELNEQLAAKAETALSRTDREKLAAVMQKDLLAEQKNLQEYESVVVKGRKSQSFSVASRFYSWSDDMGNSGSQLYLPLSYTLTQGAMDYTIESGMAFSNNKNEQDGRIDTLTDTTLSATYTQPIHRGDALYYTIGFNLPTGTDALPHNGPVMTDDLVENNRFGEGLDITPEIWWHHRIDKKNMFVLGTYYNFLGHYDLDSLDSSSQINPGNSWVMDGQWKFLDKKVQFLLEFCFTRYESTTERRFHYRSGNRLAPNLTVNYAPDSRQFFTVYWWNTNEQPLKDTSFDALKETRLGNNIGLQWSRKLNAEGRFHLGFDYLRRNGENFDPITGLTTNRRRKVTYRMGYDRFLDKKHADNLGIDVEWFRMDDSGAGVLENRYRGCNVYLHFRRQF